MDTASDTSVAARIMAQEAIAAFTKAGRAYFTLVGKTMRFTFRVVTEKTGCHRVEVLTGPENTDSYTVLGYIDGANKFHHANQVDACRAVIARNAVNKYGDVGKAKSFFGILSAGRALNEKQAWALLKAAERAGYVISPIGSEAPSLKAFGWFWTMLTARLPFPAPFEFWHAGRCGRCGRLLTDPVSISLGVGPKCAEIGR